MKAAKDLERISITKISDKKGFSLIEMMIVVVIAGMFVAIAAKNFVSKGTQIKSEIRKFSVLAQKLRNRARLDNQTYRLVFDLPIETNKQQSYWVETTDKPALLMTSEEREELERDLDDVETSDGKRVKPDPQGFVANTKVLKEAPAVLPEGLFFDLIEVDGDPIKELKTGRIYIYFFPQGYVQFSAIHISDRKTLNWTLVLNGLTGRVDIHDKDRSLKEFKQDD